MTKEHEESSGLGERSEATLFRQAQAGCRDSLNALMERHAGLIAHVVNHQQRWGLPYEDALQAGRLGLWCAILGYDPQRGGAFSTYTYVSIMHHVWAAVKRYRQQQDGEPAVEELAVFFDRVTPDPAGGAEAEIEHILRALVRRLPPRWRRVVIAHYGLDGQPPCTYQEIGVRWGVSRQRVNQLAAGALAWLRHPAHSQELRSLLSRHTLQQYELAEEGVQAWLRQRGGRRHPTELTPEQSRTQDQAFVSQCSLMGLHDRLPLRWPTPPATPPSPKRSYRSQYVYQGWDELPDPDCWEQWSEFDWVLRLVDFSGLRAVLAQLLGWQSGRRWKPFDPLSLFLLTAWQLVNRWSQAETLRNLRQRRYADYAQRFGFREGVLPSEGGLRYFLTALGGNPQGEEETVTVAKDERAIAVAVQRLNRLLAQSISLIRDARLLSETAWEAALVCPDGQLHDAASRMRCQAVTETCYQATTAEKGRPCPAKEKGQCCSAHLSPTCLTNRVLARSSLHACNQLLLPAFIALSRVCFHDQAVRTPPHPVLHVLLRFGHPAPARWRSSTPSFARSRLSGRSPASKSRHREGDFDFGRHLSQISPNVTNVLICTMFSDPVAPLGVRTKSIHQPEKDLVVRIDLHPLCWLLGSSARN